MATRNRCSGWVRVGLFSLLFIVLWSPMASAATLVIDGQFDDWDGQPHVEDGAGDGPTPNTDILTFYWGTNPGDEHVYWMMERAETASGNPRVYYFVFLDTNRDGSYSGSEDRLIQIFYDPDKNVGEVTVTVYTGSGSQISQSSGNWGDSQGEGGSRAEWRVSFSDLGIDAHQSIDMYAAASQNSSPEGSDLVPSEGDITWSPIPVLGWPLLVALGAVAIGVTWLLRGRHQWQRSRSG